MARDRGEDCSLTLPPLAVGEGDNEVSEGERL